VVARRKDGTTFPVYLGVSEVQLGERRLFTGLIQDLSERRQAEARLREVEKAAADSQRLADIGAITAQIVHDLGNPLAGISMQAQLICRRARRNPSQALETVLKPAEQIVDRVKHLDYLVHDFLEFAREQRLQMEAVDFAKLLADLGGFWRPVANVQGINVTLDLPGTPVIVSADHEKLRRVLDNLIKNAIEAIGDGPGNVTIRLDDSSPERIRIGVIDSGPGIPQDLDIFRLFETTKPLGTGLGLPIARQIISAHGGGIEVAGVEPHGAHFQLDLPRRV
jgi:two-component system sensor kinase FixL